MKLPISLVVLILLFAACKKNKNEPFSEPGCIQRVYTTPGNYLLSTADSARVDSMFRNNGIDINNFQPYEIAKLILFSENGIDSYMSVKARHFSGQLLYFEGDVTVYFKSGAIDSMYYMSGNADGATPVGVVTTPELSLEAVRKIYLKQVNISSYKDTCLVAEFGLYNTAGPNGSMETRSVWRVTPEHSQFPLAYISNKGDYILLKRGS